MAEPVATDTGDEQQISFKSEGSIGQRFLNSLLDGGKDGVGIGLAISPGVLCISTIVMMLTFGPSSETGTYTGAAYEGVPIITWLADKINFIFYWLFGFESGALVSFPITALGAVGAAIGLVPRFITEGIINNNAIAVFTAMGMCWSGYLSTHTAMLDALGYRKLIGKAIGAHTIGGLCAGIAAHWLYVALALIF
jgi:ABC-type cobalt transport system substrate-binding protein